MTKPAVIYYSATGHGTTMAQHLANAGERAGAEVRVRHIVETHDPAPFAHNPAWAANYNATKDLPAASGDDILWADAVIFGSPTRFGSPAAHSAASSTHWADFRRRANSPTRSTPDSPPRKHPTEDKKQHCSASTSP
ncbi:MAG: NAD(P)H:quinone oxidoreductase, type [Mycobacterium sp.]|jgi:hypothetical protein|nr:NAD(P)H:quinone oxidoreductase, type [Mycobacterium sp.]MDT5369385.1 hypothetical protein [Mycobacterium sp.]